MSGNEKLFSLRKTDDPEIYGPMGAEELRQLIDSAYVSPEDEVSVKEGEWRPVIEFAEFGMVWKILADDGKVSYGPTSLGTVKEFIRTGEIGVEDKILKTGEKTPQTIAAVLGEKAVEELRAEIEAAQIPDQDQELEEALETAREIRIRNLETDYRNLKREYDELKRKYLQLCEAAPAKKPPTPHR